MSEPTPTTEQEILDLLAVMLHKKQEIQQRLRKIDRLLETADQTINDVKNV